VKTIMNAGFKYQQSKMVKGHYPGYYIIDLAIVTPARRIAVIPCGLDIQKCCKKDGMVKKKYEIVFDEQWSQELIEKNVVDKIRRIEGKPKKRRQCDDRI